MIAPEIVLPAGTTLAGRYRLGSVIGLGGMAVVYEATQVDLDRRVAVKVLNHTLAGDDAFRRRFRREARLAAALDHPNIVTVHDFGEADEGMYLAMAMVNGETLAQRIASEELTAAESMDVLSRLAAALDHAHSRRMVHGDVKPQNVLLDDAGGVYLADFGVAKSLTATATATSGVLGTVRYVAPEQIRGQQPTPASDLYSLAVVAYECLSGSHPYAGASNARLLTAHLEDPPFALSPRRGGRNSAINDPFEAALAKHAASRPSGASAFVRELDGALGRKGRDRPERPAFARVVPAPVAVQDWEADADGADTSPIETKTSELATSEFEAGSRTVRRRRSVSAVWPVSAAAASLMVPVLSLATRPNAPAAPEVRTAVAAFEGTRAPSLDGAATSLIAGLIPSMRGSEGIAAGSTRDLIAVTTMARGAASLAPVSPERSRVVNTPAGQFRRFESGHQIVFIGQSRSATAVLACPAQSTDCDRAISTFRVSGQPMQADPIRAIAERLRASLAEVERSRATVVLPSHDVSKRADRAASIAATYRDAERLLSTLASDRPRDLDLRDLRSAMSGTSTAFIAIARAARDKSAARDRAARAALSKADQSTAKALKRLVARGYTVEGISE